MDVVKTNIEKIGGTVDLQSEVGAGTTLKIKIPLTLAIIPALIVSSGGDRFAIPQVSLLELVRLEGEQARREIESIHGAPVYRLRGQLLPLVYLNRELKLAPAGGAGGVTDAVNIVVLQADGHPFGLVVDEINDTEEIVVKPLGKQLKGVAQFAGATIMGDGRVALILDVLGFAQGAGVLAETRNRALRAGGAQVRTTIDTRQTLLLFEAGQGSRMAIPLSLVARLEEIPHSSVEYSGHQEVVRYRGQILPLIRIARHVPAIREETEVVEPMQVAVYTEGGRSVGLVVGRISDIVKVPINEKRHAPGNGIFGSVTINDKVVDLLDVQSLIRAADPTFYGTATAAAA
jgi:two-component system chemotaxis sensor kinase CheA